MTQVDTVLNHIEVEILRHLAHGKTCKEIRCATKYAEHSIETMVGRMKVKMEAINTPHMIHKAHLMGIL